MELEIDRDGVSVPTSLVTPVQHRGELPGWIVLGGVTSKGRFHPQMVRFTDALAASGAAVLVPEIPEWRDLRLTPGVAEPTVRAAIRGLDARPEVGHGRYGLVGFSFGAAQAVIASNQPVIADRIAGVLSFGGYCDFARTLRFQLTGLHEWLGETHRIDPDPYGRWVLASNYLVQVPDFAAMGDVSAALRRMALASTEGRIPGWDPRLDALKSEQRCGLRSTHRALFDLFAPSTGTPLVDDRNSEEVALALAEACLRAEPLLEPAPHLEHARVPVHLFHGRTDRLIPYTESLRFRELLPTGVAGTVTVTGLFAHTGDRPLTTVIDHVRENWVLLRGLQRALARVG